MKQKNQRAESREQVVFEPEFDVDNLMISVKEKKVVFYESGSWAHSSNKVFVNFYEEPLKAYKYGQDVIARYKRLIAAAELAFILANDRSDIADQFDNVHLLDGDFVKVVRAADEGQEGEGAG